MAELRMLVRKLHSNPAAERLPNHGRPVDVEDFKKITDTAGERAQRVVADRLFGQTVTHEVRRDHGKTICQSGDHVPPGPRTTGDAVQKQQRRPATLLSVGHIMAVY